MAIEVHCLRLLGCAEILEFPNPGHLRRLFVFSKRHSVVELQCPPLLPSIVSTVGSSVQNGNFHSFVVFLERKISGAFTVIASSLIESEFRRAELWMHVSQCRGFLALRAHMILTL